MESVGGGRTEGGYKADDLKVSSENQLTFGTVMGTIKEEYCIQDERKETECTE